MKKTDPKKVLFREFCSNWFRIVLLLFSSLLIWCFLSVKFLLGSSCELLNISSWFLMKSNSFFSEFECFCLKELISCLIFLLIFILRPFLVSIKWFAIVWSKKIELSFWILKTLEINFLVFKYLISLLVWSSPRSKICKIGDFLVVVGGWGRFVSHPLTKPHL